MPAGWSSIADLARSHRERMVQSISRNLLRKSRCLQCDVYVGEPVFGLHVLFKWHGPDAECRCGGVPPVCSFVTQSVFSIYSTIRSYYRKELIPQQDTRGTYHALLSHRQPSPCP